MIVNGKRLIEAKPVDPFFLTKNREHGVSWGLGEAGYDVRLKQTITFHPTEWRGNSVLVPPHVIVDGEERAGLFTIASTVERFQVPTNLVATVHDKSTLARRGLSVFTTVIEPGWGLTAECYLTLELVYHGPDVLHLPAGSGIAQVIFHEVSEPAQYTGKYAAQGNHPVAAIMEGVDRG